MLAFCWYFLVQVILYSLVTLPRTLSLSQLGIFSIYGAFLYILRWSLSQLFFGSAQLSWWLVLLNNGLDVTLITLLLLWFFRWSSLGKVCNLLDAIAIGAAVGLGYELVYFSGANFSQITMGLWPPGSVASPVDIIPAIVFLNKLSWAGYAGWGALISLSIAWPDRNARLPKQIVLPVIVALVFLEIVFNQLYTNSLLGPPGEPLYVVAQWLFRLTLLGHLGGLLLLVAWIGVLLTEDRHARKTIAQFPWLKLEAEPAFPNLVSEWYLYTTVVSKGWKPVQAVSEFLRVRNRLVDLTFRAEKDPSLEYSQQLAMDQAARQFERTRRILAGQSVDAVDPVNVQNRYRTFWVGLITTVIGTLCFMVMIGWLGNLFTGRMGPMGYFYATGLVSAMVYVLAFYRADILTFLMRWKKDKATPAAKPESSQS